ncbi:MAG TPA: ferritin-like domain-containing protein [Solirubrobacterales bacterium]|nr:ferritin-like domain-containing protein [Solirubrobacterales bacterium]
MAPNRITRGGATLAALVLVLCVGGCGGGSSSTTSTTATTQGATKVVAETSGQAADAALLDKVLGRQEAAAAAYAKVITSLPPHLNHVAFYFRRQEQEHVDAVIKALRGLGSPAEPSEETIEPGEPKTDRERLEFLYEVEGATIDEELSAISKLEASWPRSLLASIVADQAQHLTLLRRALGAGPLASIPTPFENGTFPPPLG